MLYFTKSKADCMGCSACMASCPQKCISMRPDEEGFLYPVASDECIHCGKCERVCPLSSRNINNISEERNQRAYCAVSKNHSVWLRSASGGAFSEICNAVGDDETVICGAAWDGLNVHHICVEGIKHILPLCKSKYVASSMQNTFFEVKTKLDENKQVIFCGSPCQVAGLKQYLGRDYSKLLLIDLICHGVGSPKVFRACIDSLSEQFNCEVVSYEFRAKRNAYQTDHIQRIYGIRGNEVYLQNDPYIQLFLQQLCLRPSCGANCKFRSEKRQGDITIADFKGLTEVFPDLNGAKKNYSSIIANTEKGEKIVNLLYGRMEIRECSIDDIKKYNPLFYRHTWSSDKRDSFFEDFIVNPQNSIEKWCNPAELFEDTLKRKLWRLSPKCIRKVIINLLFKGG